MRTLLVVMLLAGPAFAEVNASHFNGALTRTELESEYRRIDSEKPGLGMPIGFMAGGGGGLVVGGLFILEGSGIYGSSGLLLLGGIAVIVGGVFIVIGVINLIIRIVRRNECDAQLAEINARLDALDRNGEQPPPPPPGFDNGPPPPPPPPPLPPGASWQGPDARMLLASF
jgi:hypothetical protein